jgi:transposase InsO family protein
MSVRLAIVEADPRTLNVTEFCRLHGVSTWFFWDLRRRYALDPSALEPRSRAPMRVVNRTPASIEDEIIAVRKRLADFGLDHGPVSIYDYLDLQGVTAVPAPATIWRILKRRGFIVPEPKKAPKHSYRRFTAERANECWQIDDFGWELADGSPVKVIDIEDDCSRLLVRSKAVLSCNRDTALEAFCEGAQRWGWPEWFLSDNGSAYRHGLHHAVAALGVRAGHSRPHHPQTCGKVERLHKTVQRFLKSKPLAETIEELQTQLDLFETIYNEQRRHRGIDRRLPAVVWATTAKSGPVGHPITAPTTVYTSTVAANGVAAAGDRYRISLGAEHADQTARLVVTGTACHAFIDGALVRSLTINPDKRFQAIYNRPGRPNPQP